MKKSIALAAVAACVAAFAEPAPSRAWVRNFVSNFVQKSSATIQAEQTEVNTNGCTVITTGSGEDQVVLTIEDATVRALKASAVTSAAVSRGVTNDMRFVWSGGGSWLNPSATITSTATNFVFDGVGSAVIDGVDTFPGLFSVTGVMIQPSVALSITNGMEIVK